MDFKEFLSRNSNDCLLSEVGNVMNLPTDHIEFEYSDAEEGQSNACFKYRFKSDNDDYEVTVFKEPDPQINGFNVDNVYLFQFQGPDDWFATNRSNNPLKVYQNVLLAFRKFIDQYNPNVICYSPFEPQMELVYDRFVKRFLKGKFIRVSDRGLVSVDCLRKLMQSNRGNNKDTISNILNVNRNHKREKQNLALVKNKLRKVFPGTVIRIEDPKRSLSMGMFLKGIDSKTNGLIGYVFDKDRVSLKRVKISPNFISDNQNIPEKIADRFLKVIKDHPELEIDEEAFIRKHQINQHRKSGVRKKGEYRPGLA